ncbi:MAG: thioredoxin family protein [Pontiellaceae bacterium]|nr:thioredoxin family protein [Pontiellaceae bacterium]MBN2785932.1 thioredoxin family protein [Pontiellaceae bacterium]
MKKSESDPQSSAAKGGHKKSRMFWRVFWLTFLVLSLAYAWYCFYTPSNSVSWFHGYTEAQEKAVQSDKPMVLFFTATWCVPCRIMKRTVWADEQVTTEVNEQFIPLMLYADDPDMAGVFKRYGVMATPTTIITDPRGNVLDWVQGKIEKNDFLNFLRQQRTTD